MGLLQLKNADEFQAYLDTKIICHLLTQFAHDDELEDYTVSCFRLVIVVTYKLVGEEGKKCFVISPSYGKNEETLEFSDMIPLLKYSNAYREYCKGADIEFQEFIIVTNKFRISSRDEDTHHAMDSVLNKRIGVLATNNYDVYYLRETYVLQLLGKRINAPFIDNRQFTTDESVIIRDFINNLTETNNQKLLYKVLDYFICQDLKVVNAGTNVTTQISHDICYRNETYILLLQSFLRDDCYVLNNKYFTQRDDMLVFQKEKWIEEHLIDKFTKDVDLQPSLDISDVRLVRILPSELMVATLPLLKHMTQLDFGATSTLLSVWIQVILDKMVKNNHINISKEEFKSTIKNLIEDLKDCVLLIPSESLQRFDVPNRNTEVRTQLSRETGLINAAESIGTLLSSVQMSHDELTEEVRKYQAGSSSPSKRLKSFSNKKQKKRTPEKK